MKTKLSLLLNDYAKNYQEIYPIAARCGVFAKTDIQPLINEGARREDIAASIFQAVVSQTIRSVNPFFIKTLDIVVFFCFTHNFVTFCLFSFKTVAFL